MAREIDLPLPQLTDGSREEFLRAWTRFDLVATAKGWDQARKLVVLPTLLRGKLVDYYMELGEEISGNLTSLKGELMKKAGFQTDPLVAGKNFMSCVQQANEKAENFAIRLRKLFKQAFEDEEDTSHVLLQRFITGLSPKISRQLLLEGKPETLEVAIKRAARIEYAFEFETKEVVPKLEEEVIGSACYQIQDKTAQTLDEIVRRLNDLESKLGRNQPRGRVIRAGRPQGQNRKCWSCGEIGHIRRDCPLNMDGPAQRGDSWPRK
jgi:hypothetical protein